MENIGFGTYLIDLYDLSMEKRTGSYVILANDLTIIETSASPSHDYLLKGLSELNIPLESIKNIIVTHIHLDHSGGAGLLMEKCPNATLFVHPKGAPHLSNPAKLIASAKQVYGEDFDRLFDPILPVNANRIHEVFDGEELLIGENHKLTFLFTPGHANHHISIFDSNSKYIYTGDTLGIYYPQLKKEIGTYILPSTSPNQFSKQLTLNSLEKIKEFNPDAICFGHYGLTDQTQVVYNSLTSKLDLFIEIANKVINEYAQLSFNEKSKKLSEILFQEIKQDLLEKNIQENHSVFQLITLDIEVSSMGLILALDKK
ncbi:MBL fold metallo-hydrolase [Bacillus sp. EAC]|uniref:MBL fold metallo-hydrolase n=1 Tax=Bacillus sp. EAC TaxID=1978338 RepID=UPI00211B145E|nr:MBL fold metallo-hydrolase [Bacillus sp. EAC]